MEFPDTETIETVLDEKEFPSFAQVTYDPQTPELDDVRETACAAIV